MSVGAGRGNAIRIAAGDSRSAYSHGAHGPATPWLGRCTPDRAADQGHLSRQTWIALSGAASPGGERLARLRVGRVGAQPESQVLPSDKEGRSEERRVGEQRE